jgi:hypothetical protein
MLLVLVSEKPIDIGGDRTTANMDLWHDSCDPFCWQWMRYPRGGRNEVQPLDDDGRNPGAMDRAE